MKPRVLLVDDEVNVLKALSRHWNHAYDVHAATHATEALETIAAKGPFAVVVSDLRMPGKDGIVLLSEVRKLAPDSIRIMLTGYADLQTAIQSVNEGRIFRFLTKPIAAAEFGLALEAGVEQYRLIMAEKELLEQTLKGSVKALVDLLGLVNPTAFGRATRIHRMARRIAEQLQLSNLWEIETAALLSQIGCVTLPEAILRRVVKDEPLTKEEAHSYAQHPEVGHDLIAFIPRMQQVAEMVRKQNLSIHEADDPDSLPMGARILNVVLDYDDLEGRYNRPDEALKRLRQFPERYDANVVEALEDVVTADASGSRYRLRTVTIDELEPPMLFAQDVWSRQGPLLVSRGQEATTPLIVRLRNYARHTEVEEPIRVLLPIQPQ